MDKLLIWDKWLFEYLRQGVGFNPWVDRLYIVAGVWLVYLLPLVLVAGWFWSVRTKRTAFKAGLAGILAWEGFSKIIAYFVQRVRPAEAIVGVRELIFHRPDTSFPSDHTAALFAVALTVRLLGHRKLGNGLLILAVVIAVGRVMIGVHWPGDIIGGVLVGIVTALLVWRWRQAIDHYLTEPFINLMRKFRL